MQKYSLFIIGVLSVLFSLGGTTWTEETTMQGGSGDGLDILISHTATGLIIASKDTKALDDFEALLRLLSQSRRSDNPDEYLVLYLKNRGATETHEMLRSILDARVAEEAESDAGGEQSAEAPPRAPKDDLSLPLSAVLNKMSKAPETELLIVPEPRLNLLIVSGPREDVALVKELTSLLDQRTGPAEVQLMHPPKLIPLNHVSAERVCETIRTVFAPYVVGGGMFFGNEVRDQSRPEMTVSFDRRTNRLVVAAPDELFREVSHVATTRDAEHESLQVNTLAAATV